jgi:hypothetical protein
MLSVALVAHIVERPVPILGDGGVVVVCRIRPLESIEPNWRIETPLDDDSAPLLDLRPGATVFVQGDLITENRKRGGVRWGRRRRPSPRDRPGSRTRARSSVRAPRGARGRARSLRRSNEERQDRAKPRFDKAQLLDQARSSPYNAARGIDATRLA